MSGWISIHRKLKDHWLWGEKPFDKRSAWIDLLLMANHKDNKFLLGNELIEVKRGSFITSEHKLMAQWGWSKSKVRNFLSLLESDGMIVKVADRKKTTLTIVNYNDYQVLQTAEEPLKDQERTTGVLGNKEMGAKLDGEKETASTVDKNNDCQGLETTKEPAKDQEKTTKEPQKDPNNNENNDNKSLFMYSENLKNVVRLLEKNIGVIPPILIDEVSDYSDVFNLDMFSEAIKIACNKKVRTVNFVLGILRNWKDNNIIKLSDLEAFRKEKELEREEQKKRAPGYQSNNKPQVKTKFHNFEQKSDKYTEDDLEKVAKRKREEAFRKMKGGA